MEEIENESNRSFVFKNGEQNIVEEESANALVGAAAVMLALITYI